MLLGRIQNPPLRLPCLARQSEEGSDSLRRRHLFEETQEPTRQSRGGLVALLERRGEIFPRSMEEMQTHPLLLPREDAHSPTQSSQKVNEDKVLCDVRVELQFQETYRPLVTSAPCQHQEVVELLDKDGKVAHVLLVDSPNRIPDFQVPHQLVGIVNSKPDLPSFPGDECTRPQDTFRQGSQYLAMAIKAAVPLVPDHEPSDVVDAGGPVVTALDEKVELGEERRELLHAYFSPT